MTFTRPAPGDREQLVDAQSGLRLEATAFYQSLVSSTSRAVIDEIRDYFAINPAARDYRWRGATRENGQVETASESKIHIAVAHPDQGVSWPYVVLRSVGGSLQDLWLGQRMGTLVAPNPNYSRFEAVEARRRDEDYDEPREIDVGERFGGKLTLNVRLEVGTIGTAPTAENAVVVDLLLHGLFLPIRRLLSKRGIEWIPGTGSFSDEEVTPRQGVQERTLEARRTVAFAVQTEWYSDFFYTVPAITDVLVQRAYLSGREPPLPRP